MGLTNLVSEKTVTLRHKKFRDNEADFEKQWKEFVNTYSEEYDSIFGDNEIYPYLLSVLRTERFGRSALRMFVCGLKIGIKIQKGRQQ